MSSLVRVCSPTKGTSNSVDPPTTTDSLAPPSVGNAAVTEGHQRAPEEEGRSGYVNEPPDEMEPPDFADELPEEVAALKLATEPPKSMSNTSSRGLTCWPSPTSLDWRLGAR